VTDPRVLTLSLYGRQDGIKELLISCDQNIDWMTDPLDNGMELSFKVVGVRRENWDMAE
jgi:hypothetical protein